MKIKTEVAVINATKTMCAIFEESNLPDWANRMVQIRTDDKVDGDGIVGTVDMFGYNRKALPQAIIKTDDGSRHRVSLLKLKKL